MVDKLYLVLQEIKRNDRVIVSCQTIGIKCIMLSWKHTYLAFCKSRKIAEKVGGLLREKGMKIVPYQAIYRMLVAIFPKGHELLMSHSVCHQYLQYGQ